MSSDTPPPIPPAPFEPVPPALPVTPPPPPRFTLGTIAWIAWLLGGGFIAFLYWRTAADTTNAAFRFGEAMGVMVAALILPTLISWCIWRLAGRHRVAGQATFFAMLALTLMGQLPQLVDRARRRDGGQRLQALQERLRTDMQTEAAKGRVLSLEQREQYAKQTERELQAQAAGGNESDRGQAAALQVMLKQITETTHRHDAARHDAGLDDFFAIERLATAADRSARTAAIARFRSAVAEMRKAMSGSAEVLQAEMQKNHVDERRQREVLAGYHDAADAKLPLLSRVRDIDELLADAQVEFVSFAEKFEGRWSRNAEKGTLVLPSNEAVAEFNALLARVQKLQNEQLAIQKELLTPR